MELLFVYFEFFPPTLVLPTSVAVTPLGSTQLFVGLQLIPELSRAGSLVSALLSLKATWSLLAKL